MYTRKLFGIDLKNKIEQKELIPRIGEWAHAIYLQHIEDIDLEFRDILLRLNTMELGQEFEFSYEELEKIANDLIAGRDVNI